VTLDVTQEQKFVFAVKCCDWFNTVLHFIKTEVVGNS